MAPAHRPAHRPFSVSWHSRSATVRRASVRLPVVVSVVSWAGWKTCPTYLYTMKLVLPILLLTVFLSSAGRAQSIPEGATGIDLRTSSADSSLYHAVQDFLETQDYIIEEADEAHYTLATERHEGTDNVRLQVKVSVEDGIAHFTAEGRILGGDTSPEKPFVYEGDRKAGFMVLNRLVDLFAKSFDLATMEYEVP